MKEVRTSSRYIFYMKILFTSFLVASLALLQTPYAIADRGQDGNLDGDGTRQASLSVEKTVDFVTALPRVTFGIEKSVDKSAITLNPGGSSEVTYTVNVTRNEATETSYSISGTITAHNTSHVNAALVTKVEDVVEYHVSGPDWTEAKRFPVFSGTDTIAPADSKTYNYNFTFTAPAGAETWRNVAYVTISNRGGEHPNEPYLDRISFDLPEPDNDVPNQVQVTDSESLTPSDGGVSFAVTSVNWDETSSSDPDGPWTVTPPETITVHKTVTASATAIPGKYTLHNTARIGEEGPSDSADVTITIPTPPSGGGESNPPSGGGGGGTGQQTTAGGGGGGGEQPATVATTEVTQPAPTPAPEQAAVLPAVVSQPAPAPAAAQAKPKALPKKLPFTGVNFWYLSSAVLLMTVGLVLQLFRNPLPRHLRKAKW